MQPPQSPAAADAPQSLWAELRDALRGTNADYTRIPLRRAVFLLAVPMVLELVLESTFAVVDIFFVSKLGPSAVATVGLTEAYLFLLYSLAMGLAMAVTAVIARRIGEGKKEEAAVTAVQAIIVALLASLLPAIIILLREILVSGLREYLATLRIGLPVTPLAKWKTGFQMGALGVLLAGDTGAGAIGLGFLPVGWIGEAMLWTAAALTLLTGWDYLRAGLRHATQGTAGRP